MHQEPNPNKSDGLAAALNKTKFKSPSLQKPMTGAPVMGFCPNRATPIIEVTNHMKRLRVWVPIFLIALVWCVSLSGSVDQGTDLKSVLKQFPGYHLLSLQERDPDVKAFLAQHFPKSNPSVVRADFNSDGNPDYALLLKDDKSGATKLVVLLCSADGKCKSSYEVDETTYASAVYLRPVSTGSKVSQTEAIPGNTLPVKLRAAGIQVNYFEKGKVVLRWNRKRQKIEEVQTSD
jgi:hypothetical protein